MSKRSESTPVLSPKAWAVPAAVAGLMGAAVISYVRSEETQAAAGSPYYGKAVLEAISGLRNPGDQSTPAARPPLAAGLSPDEHYWCENCKTYHKREAGQNQPAPVAQVPATVPPVAAAQAGDAIPPLPAGLSAADHYWCVNCKTYHARQPGQAVPETGVAPAPAPAPWRGVPYPLSPAAPVPGN